MNGQKEGLINRKLNKQIDRDLDRRKEGLKDK